MNKLLHFNTSKHKCFFFSDPHLNHEGPRSGMPLWQSRGYTSPADMTANIIRVTNEIVGPDDDLFCLGDWCLNTSEIQFIQTLKAIKCQNIYMIWGNHNNPPQRVYEREVAEWLRLNDEGNVTEMKSDIRVNGIAPEIYPFRYLNLIFMGNHMEISVDGQYIQMSHYPVYSWNHMRSGAWMLHGHMHCYGSPTNGKILDLGWDGYNKPLSFAEVKAIMDIKPITGDGGHH